MPTFEYSSRLAASPAEAFRWHVRPGAFERLNPPWETVRVVDRQGSVLDGGRVTLRICKGVCFTWTLQHKDIEPGRQFVDEQVHGPFRRWRHVHRFAPEGNGDGCILTDHIDYELPLGHVADSIAGQRVKQMLTQLFRYRHQQLQHELARHRLTADLPPQRIVVSGTSGLIGSALCRFLTSGGHRVDRLVRHMPLPGTTDIRWNPSRAEIDAPALEGADIVVHLAGENVAGRWTGAKKRAILESRTQGTRLLSESLARLARKPRVLISASAIGYYGDRGTEILREGSALGAGFLADVCQAWEAAADPARQAGVRVVHPRIGVVLSGQGGLLRALLPLFRIGAGGPVGAGGQYISWIDIDDLLSALHHTMFTDTLSGAINMVSPNAVTNRHFSETLARVLGRPMLLGMPGPLARLMLGQFADETLLASQRAAPDRLIGAGFAFWFSELERSLRRQLGRLA